MSDLDQAIALAAHAHRGQRDKGGAPYILHPLRVMMDMTTDEERIVAVLHDVLEDAPLLWSAEKVRALGFSEAVMDALDCLTRRKGESYAEFIDRAASNPIARVVKIADLCDNSDLSRIPNPSLADYARREKYRLHLAALCDTAPNE
jgi:(p)ppGpp synthase/HD superfamily hydrolase